MKIVKKCVSLIIILLLTVLLLPGPAAAKNAYEKMKEAALINMECLKCHGAQGLKTYWSGKKVSLYVPEEPFKISTHGTNACTTCHDGMTNYPHNNLEKENLKAKVNIQCAKCHDDINKVYTKSVHNEEKSQGEKKAYCSDCHGFHNIRKKESSSARVYKNNIPTTCTRCHSGKIKEAYKESFHGKAVFLKSKKAASCTDCHGSHDILGPEDRASTVAKENIPKTCAKCHARPQANFAEGKEHFLLKPGGPGAPMYYIYKFLTWLTIIVCTWALLHILAELYTKLKNARKEDDSQ